MHKTHKKLACVDGTYALSVRLVRVCLMRVRVYEMCMCVKFCHNFYLYSNWEMTLRFFSCTALLHAPPSLHIFDEMMQSLTPPPPKKKCMMPVVVSVQVFCLGSGL